jgi:hypothetical protein
MSARWLPAKGLRPPILRLFPLSWAERCSLLDAAHAEKGTIAYSPLAFWAGVALIFSSFLLQILPRVSRAKAGNRGCSGC